MEISLITSFILLLNYSPTKKYKSIKTKLLTFYFYIWHLHLINVCRMSDSLVAMNNVLRNICLLNYITFSKLTKDNWNSDQNPWKIPYERARLKKSCRLAGFNINNTENWISPYIHVFFINNAFFNSTSVLLNFYMNWASNVA